MTSNAGSSDQPDINELATDNFNQNTKNVYDLLSLWGLDTLYNHFLCK